MARGGGGVRCRRRCCRRWRRSTRRGGQFSGPVPLIARVDFDADLAALKSAGVRPLPEEALAADVAAAAAAGAGARVGARRRRTRRPPRRRRRRRGATPAAAAAADDGVAVLGDWEGDADELDALREAGFGPLLLRDGCDGSVGDGRYRCEALIKASKSKRSKLLSGSMFGVSENDGPSATADVGAEQAAGEGDHARVGGSRGLRRQLK